jgi:hypothetical protein
MAVRACKVTCMNPGGVKRAVSAQSLCEAVAQVLRIFREDAWCNDLWQSAASLVVKISQPAVEHRVYIKDFTNRLDSAGKSPAEMTLKSLIAFLPRSTAGSAQWPQKLAIRIGRSGGAVRGDKFCSLL